MKKKLIFLVVLVVVAGLIVGGVKLVKKRKAEDAKLQSATIYPLVVKAIQPKQGEIKTTLKYLAIVKNSKELVINSKFAGQIKYIANIGDKVQKGDTLVKIDDTMLKTNLAEINSNIKSIKDLISADKVNIAVLKDNMARTKKLLAVKMDSIEKYQNQKAKLASLTAKQKADEEKLKTLLSKKSNLENELTYTTIKSPIDGIVSAKFLNLGDNTFPAKPILKVSASNGNYLFIPLPKNYKEIIYKNKTYALTPLNTTFNGVPVYKADVNDDTLINGEKINIQVVTFDGNATLIPFDTILSSNGENFVFDSDGDSMKVDILSTGKEGVVVQNHLPKIIEANPDILLKIKAGYPIKVKN